MKSLQCTKDISIDVCKGEDFAAVIASRRERLAVQTETLSETVREILKTVKNFGDSALIEYSVRFDGVKPEQLCVSKRELDVAYEAVLQVNPSLIQSLEKAGSNIRRFSEIQCGQLEDFKLTVAPGVTVGQRVIPVASAGIYVPGGRYPLLSSVLMGVIPARTAGVKHVFLATPPGSQGKPAMTILAAASIAGADAVYVMGGAQAIAAFTYGTESVPRVDVIAGPGNCYVAEAKRQVYGSVGVDLIAGPTDILILADKEACMGNGALVIAYDMLAQAEHDPEAEVRVLIPDMESALAICKAFGEICNQYSGNLGTVSASLRNNGLFIIYDTIQEAQNIADSIAPEHLEIHAVHAESIASKLSNYGSLFLGSNAGEVLGDYAAGVNHTLPTHGSARYTSGLSVRSFIKTPTTVYCKVGDGSDALLETSMILAEAEGLMGHALSAAVRLQKK